MFGFFFKKNKNHDKDSSSKQSRRVSKELLSSCGSGKDQNNSSTSHQNNASNFISVSTNSLTPSASESGKDSGEFSISTTNSLTESFTCNTPISHTSSSILETPTRDGEIKLLLPIASSGSDTIEFIDEAVKDDVGNNLDTLPHVVTTTGLEDCCCDSKWEYLFSSYLCYTISNMHVRLHILLCKCPREFLIVLT